MKYFELLKEVSRLKKESETESTDLRIRIVSNITLYQVGDVLEYYIRKMGLIPEIEFGDYDNFLQEAAHCREGDVIIVFWEMINLFDNAAFQIEMMSGEDVDHLIEQKMREIDYFIDALRHCKLVLFNAYQIHPYENIDYEDNYAVIKKSLNDHIGEKKLPNFKILNSEKIIAELGEEAAIDLRKFNVSKTLYSYDFLLRYTQNIIPTIAAYCGKPKKALVMDCDNTLWHGVVGEDGIEGIQMSPDNPEGRPYAHVQRIVKALASRGVLICLCSKNNPEDVDEVLREHPDMLIRDEDLVLKKVNWEDKAKNLEAIALELNIGLESLVFVDDSPFEIDMIDSLLPEISTHRVPPNRYRYPQSMREIAWGFYNPFQTDEDAKKTLLYRQQAKRKMEEKNFANLDEYLESLQIKIELLVNAEHCIPRMSQMTQKTNQFNLTTKRYTEEDIRKFVESKMHDAIAIHVLDKFGESGITGLCILCHEKQSTMIDTFLMSCRILGRKIEYGFFDKIVEYASDDIYAAYIQTPKNSQVKEFYEKLGFRVLEDKGTEKRYYMRKNSYQSSGSGHVITFV